MCALFSRLGQWRGYICSLQTVKGFCCCTKRRVWVLQSLSAGRSCSYSGLVELVCWSVLQLRRSCRTCLLVGLAATAVLQSLSAGRSCSYGGLAELVCWSVLQQQQQYRRACLLVGLAAATAVSQSLSAGRSCSSNSGLAELVCWSVLQQLQRCPQNLPAVFLARRLPFLEVGGNSENVIEGNNDLLLLKPRCLFPTSASVGVAPCRHLRLGKRRRVEGRGGVGRKT